MLDTSLRRRRSNNLAERLVKLEEGVFSDRTTAFRRISLDVTIGRIADLTAGTIRIVGRGEEGSDAIVIDADQQFAQIRSDNFMQDNSGFVSIGFQLLSQGNASFSFAAINSLRLDITNNYLLVGRGKGETVQYLPAVSSRSSDGTITVGAVPSFDGYFLDDRSTPGGKLELGSVTDLEIADGAVVQGKVAPSSIRNSELVGWQFKYIQANEPTNPQLHDVWLDTTGSVAPTIPTGSLTLDGIPLTVDGMNLVLS